MRLSLALTAVLALPAPALACGGIFCNAAQPINQSAERIVFAQQGDEITMHVQIAYQGPPTEFAWILPVSPEVEDGLSSQILFDVLDGQFAPLFRAEQRWADCGYDDRAVFGGAGGAGGQGGEGEGEGEGEGGVQVLSREAVGPFDRVILTADSVGDLRDWLDENAYQVPEGVDEKLRPYVDAGSAFLALKLLPGTDAGDIQPIRLRYPGDVISIPILPTGVAAEPDMGILVHVLADQRAVPLNYLHTIINDAAIDWFGFGLNYSDVVAAAVDEAGGQAFVTDYAGPMGDVPVLPLIDVRAITAANTVNDLLGVLEFVPLTNDLLRIFKTIEGLPDDYFECPRCYSGLEAEVAGYADLPVDGAALAARIETEINEPLIEINVLFGLPYVTRMFTTMSADEMSLDPLFGFNPDLPEVSNIRVATFYNMCPEDGQPTIIETANGVMATGDKMQPIRRQRGRTIRGQNVPASLFVEQLSEAGLPVVVQDNRETVAAEYGSEQLESAVATRFGPEARPSPRVVDRGDDGVVPGRRPDSPNAESAKSDDESGCSCEIGADRTPPTPLMAGGLFMLGLVGWRRRRRAGNPT